MAPVVSGGLGRKPASPADRRGWLAPLKMPACGCEVATDGVVVAAIWPARFLALARPSVSAPRNGLPWLFGFRSGGGEASGRGVTWGWPTAATSLPALFEGAACALRDQR